MTLLDGESYLGNQAQAIRFAQPLFAWEEEAESEDTALLGTEATYHLTGSWPWHYVILLPY